MERTRTFDGKEFIFESSYSHVTSEYITDLKQKYIDKGYLVRVTSFQERPEQPYIYEFWIRKSK